MQKRSAVSIQRSAKAVVLLIALAIMIGCGKAKPQPLPPGAINTFDADAYNTLVTSQAALKQAKSEFGGLPAAKGPLNAAIDGYNAAEAAWQTYHAVGGGTDVQAQVLKANLSALVAAIASLEKQFGKIKVQDLTVQRELEPMSRI